MRVRFLALTDTPSHCYRQDAVYDMDEATGASYIASGRAVAADIESAATEPPRTAMQPAPRKRKPSVAGKTPKKQTKPR